MSDLAEHEFHVLNTKGLRSKAFRALTRQQERYVLCKMNGGSTPECRELIGLKAKGPALENVNEQVFNAMQFFREESRERVQINREVITRMMLEDRAMAQEAGVSLQCAVQLGKLHGLYESDRQKKPTTEINITQNKLEILSDSELLKQAGIETLEPIEITEGEETA